MANLSEIPLSRLFLFFFVAYSSFTKMLDAGEIRFDFSSLEAIKLSQDAHVVGDRIRLTKSEVDDSMKWSFGWATYNNSILLWDKSSHALASFSTHFQFSITKVNGANITAEGFAFFLAPWGFSTSDVYSGKWFGMFKKTTDGNKSNQIVAVEFDTYKNKPYDPDDNHVGIDVNSFKSKKTASVNGLYGNATLSNGDRWDAWVIYNGTERKLQVFLLHNPNGIAVNHHPENPILEYKVDLRKILPPRIMVGISGSTGGKFAIHSVHAWSFSCQYSWEILSPSNLYSAKIALVAVPVCFMAIFGFVLLHMRWLIKGGKTKIKLEVEESDEELDEWLARAARSARKFLFAELSAATNNFSDDQKIGGGGFGSVYRGMLIGTKESIAVKRISPTSNQGKDQYKSEVVINSKLTHHNLVKFLGWCHQRGDFLLVYELLPSGSLDKYIFGEQGGALNWDRRYNIACDIASALVYLHQDRQESILHRDIKASNVMLDSNFKAKLGDFSLARVVKRDKAGHTTVPAGTIGYIAPECVTTGKATRQSNVYSFGALALEIACGRRPVDRSLDQHNYRVVEWVWDLYGQGRLLDAADNRLGGNFDSEKMERLMSVGLLCSHPDQNARPNMEQVLNILKRRAELPNVPLNFPVAVYVEHLHITICSESTSDGSVGMVSSTSFEVNERSNLPNCVMRKNVSGFLPMLV